MFIYFSFFEDLYGELVTTFGITVIFRLGAINCSTMSG
jgi:hypothetical protein